MEVHDGLLTEIMRRYCCLEEAVDEYQLVYGMWALRTIPKDLDVFAIIRTLPSLSDSTVSF
jgi:hypothetical protein